LPFLGVVKELRWGGGAKSALHHYYQREGCYDGSKGGGEERRGKTQRKGGARGKTTIRTVNVAKYSKPSKMSTIKRFNAKPATLTANPQRLPS